MSDKTIYRRFYYHNYQRETRVGIGVLSSVIARVRSIWRRYDSGIDKHEMVRFIQAIKEKVTIIEISCMKEKLS